MDVMVELIDAGQFVTRPLREVDPRPLLCLVVDDQLRNRQAFLRQWRREMRRHFRCGYNDSLRTVRIVACGTSGANSILPFLMISQKSSKEEKKAFIPFINRFDIVYMDESLEISRAGHLILSIWHKHAPSSLIQRVLYTSQVNKEVMDGIREAQGGELRIKPFDITVPVHRVIDRVASGVTGIGKAAEFAFECYQRKRMNRIEELQTILETDGRDSVIAQKLRKEGIPINGIDYSAEELFPETKKMDSRYRSKKPKKLVKAESLEEIIRKLRLQRNRSNLSLTFSAALNGHGMAQLSHDKQYAHPRGAGFIESPEELRRIVKDELSELRKVADIMSTSAHTSLQAATALCLPGLASIEEAVSRLSNDDWKKGAGSGDVGSVSTARQRHFQRKWTHLDKIEIENVESADDYSSNFEVFFPFEDMLGDELIDLAKQLGRKGVDVTGQLWWGAWEQGEKLPDMMKSEKWQDVELFCLLQEKSMPPSILDTRIEKPSELAMCLMDRLPITRHLGEVYLVLFDQDQGKVYDIHLMERGRAPDDFEVKNPEFLCFDLARLIGNIEVSKAEGARTAIVWAFRVQKVCDTNGFWFDDDSQRYRKR